jgi:hypothetical protein
MSRGWTFVLLLIFDATDVLALDTSQGFTSSNILLIVQFLGVGWLDLTGIKVCFIAHI